MYRMIIPLIVAGLFAVSLTKPAAFPCQTCYKTMDDTVFTAGDVISFSPVLFNLGRCTLLADKDSVFNQSDSLMKVVRFINDHPSFVFEVRTHSDTTQPYSSTKLTQCRAASITDKLIALGADKNRLIARGMSDTEPRMMTQTLYLPSGDSVMAMAVLTHKFIAAKGKTKDDREFLKRQNRRSDLRVVRMDYVTPVDTTKH